MKHSKKILSMKKTTTLLLLTAILFAGCSREEEFQTEKFRMSTVLSIIVHDGKVGMSSLVNENYDIKTEYWIDSTKTDADGLKEFMPPGTHFRTSIDKYYLASTIFRKKDGTIVEYKFPRIYSHDPGNQLIYFKDGERFAIDTLAFGTIHSADAADGEVFAGFTGRFQTDVTGTYLLPERAFYINKTGKITHLPMPDDYTYFNGVSCVHQAGNDVFTGGLMNYPMYWKNKNIVRLNDNYGEVNQILTAGNDVYAVGFYNKSNSTSTAHTACYWKNGILTVLEDNAVAWSIFIDGTDIYVGGATGRFDAEYKACYWKNGKKVMLPG